jgi:hypothetical protein
MAPEALAGCSSTLASEVPRMLSHTKPKLALLIACLTSSVRLLPKTIKFPLHLQVMLFVVCNVCVCIRQQTGSEYWQSCQCCAWQCSMYEHAKWLVHIPVMQQRAASHCTIVELICDHSAQGTLYNAPGWIAELGLGYAASASVAGCHIPRIWQVLSWQRAVFVKLSDERDLPSRYVCITCRVEESIAELHAPHCTAHAIQGAASVWRWTCL